MQFILMAGATILHTAAAASPAAMPSDATTIQSLLNRLEAAEARINTADEHISDLTMKQGADWMTQERSEQIKGIVQDVLADADTRATLQGSGATSGYDKGFFIRSEDGQWSLKMNGLLQQRWNVGHQSGSAVGVTRTYPGVGTATLASASSNPISVNHNTAFGFETTRMMTQLSGTMPGDSFFSARVEYTPYNGGGFQSDFRDADSWVIGGTGAAGDPYTIQYNGTRSGGGLSSGPLEWAYAGWNIDDTWSIRIGKQKIDVSRGFIVNAEDQQAIERSAQTYYWVTSNVTEGIRLGGDFGSARVSAMVSNGSNATVDDGRWIDNNHGWGVTGRAEFLLDGTWDQFDRIGSVTGDAGVLAGIGAGYLRNGDQSRSNWVISGDVSYQANGWNVYASATAGDNDLGVGSTLNSLVNEDLGITTFDGFQDNDGTSVGFEVGGGLFVTDNSELYALWQWLSPGVGASNAPLSLAGDPSAKLNIVTLGLNHYLVNPNVKLSLDWTWSFTDPSTALAYGSRSWGPTGWWVSQNGTTTGSLWLLRTQMQLSF